MRDHQPAVCGPTSESNAMSTGLKHLAIVTMLIVWSMVGIAQQKNTTVIGQVVDVVMYLTAGTTANTPQGKEITLASANGGNPLGILDEKSGKVYIVTMKQANTGANETLLPWVGMKIQAKGDVYKRGGFEVLVLNVIGKAAQ